MGEQLNDGGAAGRRRAHPDGTASGPHAAAGLPDLEALLAAAMRPAHVDAEGERRAVAAFRAAREAGAHRVRTRRRDDWRPRTRRRTVRSLRATLSLIVASLALGGVAFAAIGTTGSSSDSADDHGTPAPSASSHPGTESATGTGAGTSPDDRPDTAKDTEAKCRAYEQAQGNGRAMESTAWERLTEAAGGEEKVAAYCAERLAGVPTESRPGADPDQGNGDSGNSDGGTNGSTGSGSGSVKSNADRQN